MTKQQELEILDKAIKQLGTDSYLGPWLAQVRGEVESNIRSDFFPQVTIRETAAACKTIHDNAKLEASVAVERANQEAARILKDMQRVRDNLCSAIHAANRELQKW